MSAKYLLNTNPASWFRTSGFHGLIGASSNGVPAYVQKDKNIKQYPAVPIEADLYQGRVYITWLAEGIKSPARFLPWEENHCTFLKIDDKADIVWTTQLSGCNMYVYTTTDGVWLFHSNSNADVSNLNANNLAKRTLANTARNHTTGTGSGRWDISLERGVQSYYPEGAAAGIFFGIRGTTNSKSSWTWYMYDPVGGFLYVNR